MREQGSLHLKTEKSLRITCAVSPGETCGTQHKAQKNRVSPWSGASPKWFCSSLIWPDIPWCVRQEGCQTQTLYLCGMDGGQDRKRSGCRKFCQHKAPLVQDLSWQLHPWARITRSTSPPVKDLKIKSIHVRSKNSSTLILGKYRTKYSDINTHAHTTEGLLKNFLQHRR